jgi:putative hydrolase of the HAD superfamily
VASELGIASWEGLWASFEGCHPRLNDLAAWAPTYRRQTWRRALAELGVEDPGLASTMAVAYEEAQREGHPLIDEVADTVKAAAARYRLGVLTNGPSDIQRLKLAQSGLAGCFEAVVVSGEVGVGKPSPDAFGLVLAAMGVRPEEAVMVGDSWERDIKGALAARVRPVWVAGNRPVPEQEASVIVIPSLAALTDALVA